MILDQETRNEARMIIIQLNEFVIPENTEIDNDGIARFLVVLNNFHANLNQKWRRANRNVQSIDPPTGNIVL